MPRWEAERVKGWLFLGWATAVATAYAGTVIRCKAPWLPARLGALLAQLRPH